MALAQLPVVEIVAPAVIPTDPPLPALQRFVPPSHIETVALPPVDVVEFTEVATPPPPPNDWAITP